MSKIKRIRRWIKRKLGKRKQARKRRPRHPPQLKVEGYFFLISTTRPAA